jgi:carboxyl-terminal processing protease
MEVGMKDKSLTVVAALKGTPAERAGIKSGDIIVKIDGKATTDMSVDEAVHLIRGKKGTSVTLTTYRQGESATRDVPVVRDTISVPMIDTAEKGDTFVISLYTFGASSANQFAKAVDAFNASGKTKLIIDLRNNPGGYLDAAVDIGSMFLPQGDTIVTESYGDGQPDDVFRSKGYGFVDAKKVKIAILVDGGSASASEILAGALQENGVAKLVGEKTYGKGSVQEVIDVTKDTTLKLTVAKWLTPNGTWISKKGIDPDIPVTVTETDIKAGKDLAMERAVQFLDTGK